MNYTQWKLPTGVKRFLLSCLLLISCNNIYAQQLVPLETVNEIIAIEFYNRCTGRTPIPVEQFTVNFFLFCQDRFPGGFAVYDPNFDPIVNFATNGNYGTLVSKRSLSHSNSRTVINIVGNQIQSLNRIDQKNADKISIHVQNISGEFELDQSNLQNGYQSDTHSQLLAITGHWLGPIDLGVFLVQTDTDATFLDDAGRQDITSDTVGIYTRFTLSDRLSLNGYYAKIDDQYNGARTLNSSSIIINGQRSNHTSGENTIQAIILSYHWATENWRYATDLEYSQVDGVIDGFTETGTTGLELIVPNQNIDNESISIDFNITHTTQLNWGSLTTKFTPTYTHTRFDNNNLMNAALTFFPDQYLVPIEIPIENQTITSYQIEAVTEFKSGLQISASHTRLNIDNSQDEQISSVGLKLAF